MIPYGRQDISQDDIDAVVEVLKSDFLTQGPAIECFERTVADFCKVPHAVASNSATSSLHIAYLALGVGPGDLVWTSPITFVATANAARYCGADVDFVDIDPDTFNMCPIRLAEKLKEAAKTGRLPKVIAPVHMGGQSCDMAKIRELASAHQIAIVEDASHCIGASYRGEPVGKCSHSDICVFSFHPVKIVTTAEGGIATTRDEDLARRMAMLRTHGITRDVDLMTREPDGPWYYQQLDLGYNYRMTDMQAALGTSQMSRVEAFVDRRNALAERYDRELATLPIALPGRQEGARSSFHLYIIRPDLEAYAMTHRELYETLRARGIGVNLHYIPVHLQPYYEKLGFKPGDFPASERYYENAISIPLYHAMSDDQQTQVIETLRDLVPSGAA